MIKLELDTFEVKENKLDIVNKTKWDYIASYVIDLRNYPHDKEILNTSMIAVTGDITTECWFSECSQEADVDEILGKDIIGDGNLTDIEPGVYRLVLGVKVISETYNTQDGVEYDSHEEYDLISKYKFNENDVKYVDGNDPMNDFYQFDTIKFDDTNDE